MTSQSDPWLIRICFWGRTVAFQAYKKKNHKENENDDDDDNNNLKIEERKVASLVWIK